MSTISAKSKIESHSEIIQQKVCREVVKLQNAMEDENIDGKTLWKSKKNDEDTFIELIVIVVKKPAQLS